jgi:uncharacterized Zn finger protein
MKCPACESEYYEILKSKGKHSKELLLKCEECGNVYKEIIVQEKPVDVRIVTSEFESSKKGFIKLYPDEELMVGDNLEFENKKVEITSIETKRGGRAKKSTVNDINTIWASSLDIPARVGISIDYGGRILSWKVDVDRDFEFHIGDIIKVENRILKVNSIKTIERKVRKGFARANVAKRVYGKPLDAGIRYNYDLSSKIVKDLRGEE